MQPSPEVATLGETLVAARGRLEEVARGQAGTLSSRDVRTLVPPIAREEPRQGDAVNQAAILNALPAQIALLDGAGNIVSANQAWRRVAIANALLSPEFGVGRNYLLICDDVRGQGADEARQAARGIRAVLDGGAKSFALDYACPAPDAERWFRIVVTPLPGDPCAGAVVMHLDVTSERHAEATLRASELRFRQMAENIPDMLSLREAGTGRTLYVSRAYEEIWGRSCESLYADPRTWSDCVHPDDRARAIAQRALGLAAGTFDFEFRIVRPDGSIRWINSRGFPVRDAAGDIVRIAGIAVDISERKESDRRHEQLNRVYAMLTGINSVIVRVSSREELFAESCRFAVAEGGFRLAWIGMVDRAAMTMGLVASAGDGSEVLTSIKDFSLRDDAPLGQSMTARAIREKSAQVSNDSIADPRALHGRQHAQFGIRSLAVLPLVVAGEAVGVLALYAGETEFFHAEELTLLTALARDIAFAIDQIDKQARLDYLAYYDVLTGLANRTLFLERVAQHLRSAARDGHKLALIVVDLERFKNINDSLGQMAGDTLLRQVAQWLTQNVSDANLVARVGADRFAVVIPTIIADGNVDGLLESTFNAFLAHPFRLNNAVFRVAVKAGIALFPDDGASADTLFMHAETALKKSKAGGDRYLFYAPTMTVSVAGSLTLENQLRIALERDEFLLYYQPKVSLRTGLVTGAEALIRWNDPRTGLVPPGRFIPILEQTGLIQEVGRWALRTAMADFKRWRTSGLAAVRVAVNVSPLQLRRRGFLSDIKQLVGADAHAAGGLELEVTEGLIMEDARNGSASLQAIRALGIQIAIDDFGTGFSSLGYLAKLPVDTLKIDRSFVSDMTASQQALALVSTIITLAHSLKLKVVAEGVETEEQSRLLRLLNCDEMQGFLFSKPLPVATFEARYLGTAPT